MFEINTSNNEQQSVFVVNWIVGNKMLNFLQKSFLNCVKNSIPRLPIKTPQLTQFTCENRVQSMQIVSARLKSCTGYTWECVCICSTWDPNEHRLFWFSNIYAIISLLSTDSHFFLECVLSYRLLVFVIFGHLVTWFTSIACHSHRYCRHF